MVDFLKDLASRQGAGSQKPGVGSPSAARNIPAASKGPFYFYSSFPGLGFIKKGTKEKVKFSGNYYKTEDVRIKDYINSHFSPLCSEITQGMYEDATELKPGKEGSEVLSRVVEPGGLPEKKIP